MENTTKCPFLGITFADIDHKLEFKLLMEREDAIKDKYTLQKNKRKLLGAQIQAGKLHPKSDSLLSVATSLSVLKEFLIHINNAKRKLEAEKNKSSQSRHYYFLKKFYEMAKENLPIELYNDISDKARCIVNNKLGEE